MIGDVSSACVWVGLGNVVACVVGLFAFAIAAAYANKLVVLPMDGEHRIARKGRAYYWHLVLGTTQGALLALWFAGANFYLFWWRDTDTYWQAAGATCLLLALLPWAVLTRITGDNVGCRCLGGPAEDAVDVRLRLAYAGGFGSSFCPVIPTIDALLVLGGFVAPFVLSVALTI